MNKEIKAAWLASMPAVGRNETLYMRTGDSYDPWGLLCQLHGRYKWVLHGVDIKTNVPVFSYDQQHHRPPHDTLEWAGIDTGEYLAATFDVYMEDWVDIKRNIAKWF